MAETVSKTAHTESNPAETRSRRRLIQYLVILGVIVAGLAFYFMAWNDFRPYPLEPRENAGIFVTTMLLKGINPYSLSTHPSFPYVYGIVYPLIVYPFAAVFGPSYLVHRAIVAVGILLSCGVLYWGMRLSRVPVKLALWGALLYFSHTALNDIFAIPNSFGLLFMFLSIAIPLAGRFNLPSVIAGLFLSVIALYTKPYFVIGAPLLISYIFLFRSKSAGLLSGLIFLAILLPSLWEVSTLLPLYFTDTVINNMNVAGHSIRHLFRVGLLYFPMGIGLVALIAWRIYMADPAQKTWAAWRPQFSLADLNKPPLLHPPIGWITYVLVACLTIYVFKMGLHNGNDLGYVFNLITPFLIWRCCIIAGVEMPERNEPLYFLQATTILVGVFFVIPMMVEHQRDHTPSWQHAADVVSHYHDPLAVGMLADILAEKGMPVYDAGQAEYFPWSFDHNPSQLVGAYRTKCLEFQKTLDDKVRGQKFDAVIMVHASYPRPLVAPDLIQQYYRKVDSFPLDMTFQNESLEVWEPIPASPAGLPAH